MIKQNEFIKTIRELGVSGGQWLFIHSSLKSFGEPFEGGPDGLIDALLTALGPQGTLLAPTHSAPSLLTFHPDRSPMYAGMGYIPKRLTEYAGSVRSHHPTHSVVAVGRDAKQILAGHHRAGALGAESPMGRLCRDDRGRILLIGVGFERMTMIHHAEAMAGLTYVGKAYGDQYPSHVPVQVGDEVVQVSIQDMPGQSDVFDRVDPFLTAAGLVRQTRLANCHLRLLEAEPCLEFIVGLLKQSPDFFLGDPQSNPFYANARRILEKARM